MPQDVYIYNPDVPVPEDVQYVEIPEGITFIKDAAFRGCSRLQSITIPDSVTGIGDRAFAYCSALQSVTIPDSVTEINCGAFSHCRNLQSITIPDSVTLVSGNIFYKCTGLQSVTIPDNVTYIGDSAFFGCSSLRSVAIPVSVTEIDSYAFENCSGLQSVTIPESIEKIKKGVFRKCESLQSITIPDSVTEIDSYAFEDCSALQAVTIPDSVTKMGNSVFCGCARLRSVTIPDSVTEISDYAFGYCSALQSITIPGSVTEIGHNVFEGCSALRSVTIPDSITKIAGRTFYKCSALRSVTIPDSVREIGSYAFYRCSGLQSVTIPDSATEIGACAFCDCSALRSVTIPNNIKTISKSAFAICPSLQTLLFKDVNIAPFINIDGRGADTFQIIRTLVEHQIPLSEDSVRHGIWMQHQDELSQWIREYPVFGKMRLPESMKSVDGKTGELLWQCFTAQKKTGHRVPEILDKLVITACVCGIPPERLADTFDIKYTKDLLGKGFPIVPAEACRCYYDRNTCNTLIQKDKVFVMAEAIALYNRSEHQECYRHLMDFILSHQDTTIKDLQYAIGYAEEIPMRAGTTLAQVRWHRTYMESLGEVEKIESEYGKTVPGFSLSDYPCNLAPDGITYDGMTARVLNLSDEKDIALAAMLGDLTNCCQRLEDAGETAMMHGFLNPDAGFWVIEDKDGKIKAQAEIWKTNDGDLVFDNIEFADTDDEHLTHRIEQLRGVIAAWAMKSRYTNIIMGCGYNELGTGSMEQAPVPELRLTPEEVYALQKGNDARVSFRNMDDVYRYMQTEKYRPGDFVYTDADEQCVYIKKDGIVSDYLMEGYDRALAEKCPLPENKTKKERGNAIICG